VSEAFLELFDLVLLDPNECVATASLCINDLGLILEDLFFGAHELGKGL
jgi:hypothetical protein